MYEYIYRSLEAKLTDLSSQLQELENSRSLSQAAAMEDMDLSLDQVPPEADGNSNDKNHMHAHIFTHMIVTIVSYELLISDDSVYYTICIYVDEMFQKVKSLYDDTGSFFEENFQLSELINISETYQSCLKCSFNWQLYQEQNPSQPEEAQDQGQEGQVQETQAVQPEEESKVAQTAQ